MTTKAVTGITIKDGKITRKIGFRAGIKRRVAEARAKKEAEAWANKNPRRSGG